MQLSRRTQKERRAFTSSRLVEAAISCLLDNGYAGANVKEISNRAGVTTGAIQHNFGSKKGLMIAVISKLFAGFDRGLTPIGPTVKPLDYRIDRFVEHYWDLYTSDRYYAVVEVMLAVRRDDELFRLNTEIRDQWLADLQDYLKIEFSDVALSPSDLRATAQEMIDFLRGYCMHRIYKPGPKTEAAAKRRARAIIAESFSRCRLALSVSSKSHGKKARIATNL